MHINKKSGFTLIEIIVVLVIVGVLAAIALPNLFSNVNKSRGAEALTTMSALKTNLELCYQAKNNISASCTMMDDANSTGTFNYVYTYADSVWSIQARLSGASSATNFINLARTVDGSITCTAAGVFAGIC